MSRVGGREGDSFISPDVQRQQIEAWANLRGAEIIAWHIDLDESGGKVDRPGLENALKRCDARLTDGLVVAKIDRFARTLPGALETIARLDAAERQFVSVAEGIDPTTPAGKMLQRLMLVLAEFELDRIRDTWRTAQERAVARGIHIASASPTGYRRGDDGRLEPNEHAEAVAAAFRRRASGVGWGDVCRGLEDDGAIGPYGGTRWSRKAVKRMLSNRVYIGEARSGEFTNAHAHPPLIDRLTFERVQEAPQQVVRGTGALLSGILRCAGCGFAMKADHMRDRGGTKIRLYRCRGQGGMIRCEARAVALGRVIEPVVVEWFMARRGDTAIEGSHLTAQLAEAERTLADAEAELVAYRDGAVIALLGRESWLEGLKVRADGVEAARAALAALPVEVLPTRAQLEPVWASLTLPEQRRLLRAELDVVWLRSGRTLPLHQRLAIFGRDKWTAGLPGQGLGRNAPRSVVWDLLPDSARMSLPHDRAEGSSD